MLSLVVTMRSSLLTVVVAVSLSGFVNTAHVDPDPDVDPPLSILPGPPNPPEWLIHEGPCPDWIRKHNEEHDHGWEGPSEVHDLMHRHDMTPECEENGNFKRKQCHVFDKEDIWCDEHYGICWQFRLGDKWCACVHPITGDMDYHTVTKGDEDLHCDGDPPEPCDKGWTFHTEHDHAYCYKFINDKKTWAEAESYCKFMGRKCLGHLASIHCEETNYFLSKLAHEDYKIYESWVGAHNTVAASLWMWSDGLHYDYEDFQKEDFEFRNNSCLRINSGLNQEWNSGPCNHTLPFICQTETLDWMEDHPMYDHHDEHEH